MAKFAVLVYNGPGVSASSVQHTVKTLRTLLQPYYIVGELSPAQLLNDPWPNTCALLVLPGGRDTPYQDALGGKGNARIRAFVEAGGSYLGICAGGYYGAAEVRFMLDDPVYKVHATRELAFWPGPCEGLVFPGFRYQSEEGSRPVELTLALDELDALGAMDSKAHGSLSSPAEHIYYNGGGAFLPSAAEGQLPSTARVLARYSQAADAPAAAVFNEVGKGRAVLVGAHPEYSLLDEPLQASLKRHYTNGDMPEEDALREAEANRLELMRVLLRTLAVALPDQQALDLELLQRPTRPLPQILLAHPSQPGALKVIEAALEPHFSAASSTTNSAAAPGPRELKDANDTFFYHQAGDLPSVADFLSQQRTTALSSAEEEDLSVVPKHVIVAPREDALATMTAEGWCPLWDWATFWVALDEQRVRVGGDRRTLGEGEKWRYGDVFYYAEAVSSTQTMIEKYVLAAALSAVLRSSLTLRVPQELASRHVSADANHLARQLPAGGPRPDIESVAQPDRLPHGFDSFHDPDRDGPEGRLCAILACASDRPGARPSTRRRRPRHRPAWHAHQVAKRHLCGRQDPGRRRQGDRGEAQDGRRPGQLKLFARRVQDHIGCVRRCR